MKFNRILLTFLCNIPLFTNAQSASDNPLIRHIPADADKVFHINYNVVSGKLDWQALGNVLIKKEEDRQVISYFSDPTKLGIDPGPGLFIAQSNVLHVDSPSYTTMLFALADSGKFIKFMQTGSAPSAEKLILHPGKPRTGIQGKTAIAWNDKIIAFTTVKAPKQASQKTPTPGAGPDVLARRYLVAAILRSVAVIRGFETSVIAADADFRTAIADDADAHIYSRYGGAFGMIAEMMRMTHAPVGKDLISILEQMKNSHMHTIGTIRFDKGRMSLRSRLFYDSLAGLDLGLRPINTDLIERLPQGNLLGFFTLHVDPTAYINLLQRFSAGKGTKMLDSALNKKGLTLRDVLSAFKGEILVAAIDKGKTVPATDSTPAKPGKPDFYLVMTIADNKAFEKINDQLHITRDTTSKQPAGDTSKPKKYLVHTLRDNILVLGADKQTTDEYFNKPGRGPSRLLSDENRTAPLVLAIDIKALGTYLAPMFADGSSKSQQAKIVFSLFDQIIFSSGKAEGKQLETIFEIKMADSEQNSLTTISKLISSMSKH